MNNDRSDKGMYCKFAFITLTKELLESEAWNELTLAQIRVFTYIWSCLQWAKLGTKRKYKWVTIDNGDIEISTVKMRKKLGICKATSTKAIHKLITVGLISLTRVGQNKICHKYKILYHIVPTNEQRWRKYPGQDWSHECPKSPNNLVGKNTQFKSHPKKLDRISINQSNKIVRRIKIGLNKYTENGQIEE